MSLTTRPSQSSRRAPWRPAAAEAAAWLKAAPRAALLELVSRVGFLARGVVYVSTGVLALLAALEVTPHAQGAVSAMASWGRWPAGLVLIWLTAAGLVGFATWRFLQAVFDADRHGRGVHGFGVRLGQAISGVAHAVLAWSLFGLLDGLEDLNEAGDSDRAQAAAAAVLAWPYGDRLLIAAGGAMLAFSVGSVAQGLFQAFAKRLGCSAITCRWAVLLARLGYIGRGVALAPMGFFLCEAGFDARATRVRDFAGALQVVEAQPFGSLALGSAAIGLVAFGLFAVFEAGFRRIELTSDA